MIVKDVKDQKLKKVQQSCASEADPYRLGPRNTKRSPNLSVILKTILPSEVHDGKSMILVGSVNARTSLGVPPPTGMT